MKPKIIIVGDGGHAKVVIDILQEMNSYEILGVTSLDKNKKFFYGLPVLGTDEILTQYQSNGINKIALGIGGFKDNVLRANLFKTFFSKGFDIINVIHPSAVISKTTQLGKGVVIFAGVVINPDVKIGNNVIIATSSSIDHETQIHDNSLISAGVTIGANVIIEQGCLCALGSKVISGVHIGKESLVAAGAVVVYNIEDQSKVFGIPAKEK